MSKPFYITTTLPYVNNDPHVGFAMEIIRADIVARWKKSEGYDVFFNTGTDEHGQKLFTAAEKAGKGVKEYVDEYAKKFRELPKALGVLEDVHFVRTTDPRHEEAAQEFWKRCEGNGYIYKKSYEAKYCVGCELEKTDSELVDGKCPIHPNLDVEFIAEENYFFKFSAFQEKLLAFYESHTDFVIPYFRYNEIKSFVSRGLEDFSISRLKSKMSWGVPVPGDTEHVMYVWFDALVSYISALGWPGEGENFKNFWVAGTPVQYCGKDNLRQQSAMWQAMLMAAGLPNTSNIIVNGFVTGAGGVKMSKSLGNVINPYDIVNEYGADALRYFVAREISPFEDSPFTVERFKESYNSGLANGLGNLTSRIMKMVTDYDVKVLYHEKPFLLKVQNGLNSFNLKEAMEEIWWHVGDIDSFIAQEKPFTVFKTEPEKARSQVAVAAARLYEIAFNLQPFMPKTSETILNLIKENKKPEQPLFARKD